MQVTLVARRFLAASGSLLLAAGCTEGTAAVGDPCVDKEECASGLCLQQEQFGQATGWTGGFCTLSCSDGCPDGSSCLDLGNLNQCVPTCDGGTGCREGYICEPGVRLCMPDCRLGWDCGDGELLCQLDGVCGAGGPPPPPPPPP